MSVRTTVLVCVLLTAPAIVGAQSTDTLIAEATAPLDDDLRDGAMVYVEYADGERRVLRGGTNGWICGLNGVPSLIAHCYEGEARQLFISVRHQDGQPMRGLRANELRLELDGGACTVMNLQPGLGKMKIALLVDNSHATRGSLNSLRDGLRAFLDVLPAEHEVGLFTISGQTRRRVDFTLDREALSEQVDNLFVDPNTATVLLDGLVETWERRFDDDDPWPVFVVVASDGPEESGSVQEREFNEFVDELRARAATVHAVLVSTQGGGLQTAVSLNITNNTGGIYRALAAATALPVVLTEVATAMGAQSDEVKDRYRVVYECEDYTSAGEVRAGVSRPDLTLRLFRDRRPDR